MKIANCQSFIWTKMDLTRIEVTKNLLKKYGIKPKKYLGQHFILSNKALENIIKAAEIKENDTIIEIGPGLGTLTQKLVLTGAKIIAVEKDSQMITILKETLKDYGNIKIIQNDILKYLDLEFQIQSQPKGQKPYKVVANLPYYITAPVIRKFLELKNQPEYMVLMVQKEVAQRICAKPPSMNLLAVGVQFFADTEIINYLSAEMFWPKPKVDSAIIRIRPKKKIGVDQKKFFLIVKTAFSQKRKQLFGNLKRTLKITDEIITKALNSSGIDPRARAQEVSLEKWLKLAKSF